MIERFPGSNPNNRRANERLDVQVPEHLNVLPESIPQRQETYQKQSLVETDTQQLPIPKPIDETKKTPDKVLVSVIINAYNEETEIGRMLESLKKEWFPGLEVIISDDGSTDRTASIVSKYISEDPEEKPEDWLVLDSHENLGFAGAKNSGAANARGEYLFFFDADAPIPGGLLQEDLRQMQERGLDIASHFVSAQNKLQKHGTAIKSKATVEFINTLIGPSRMTGCAGLLIRKDVFEKVGGFMKPAIGIGEDVDLSKRVSQIHGVRAGMIEGVKMPINMRRFEKHGYVRTLWKWLRGGLYIALENRGLPLPSIHYRSARRGPPISQRD